MEIFAIFYGHFVILMPFSVFYGYFVVIWCIFPHFAILYQEKSGNPELTALGIDQKKLTWFLSADRNLIFQESSTKPFETFLALAFH
jgi:hypothetical protein